MLPGLEIPSERHHGALPLSIPSRRPQRSPFSQSRCASAARFCSRAAAAAAAAPSAAADESTPLQPRETKVDIPLKPTEPPRILLASKCAIE
eukprot:1466087-Prymnesium_polylepis.2